MLSSGKMNLFSELHTTRGAFTQNMENTLPQGDLVAPTICYPNYSYEQLSKGI